MPQAQRQEKTFQAFQAVDIQRVSPHDLYLEKLEVTMKYSMPPSIFNSVSSVFRSRKALLDNDITPDRHCGEPVATMQCRPRYWPPALQRAAGRNRTNVHCCTKLQSTSRTLSKKEDTSAEYRNDILVL